jgi:hypothetical protein
LAITSIKAKRLDQQRLDSLLDLYLPLHGSRVDGVSLESGSHAALRQLPTALTKLSALALEYLDVQLFPGSGCQGVLGHAVTPLLKQLRLNDCTLLDKEGGLAAALDLLSGLEHLSIGCWTTERHQWLLLTGDMMLKVQQLTYLELEVNWGMWSEELSPNLKHLELQHLELGSCQGWQLPAAAPGAAIDLASGRSHSSDAAAVYHATAAAADVFGSGWQLEG